MKLYFKITALFISLLICNLGILQAKEFSDEVLSEWNGLRLGKTTQSEFLKKWPECEEYFNKVWAEVKDKPNVTPLKDRGCEFKPENGPLELVSVNARDFILDQVVIYVRNSFAKEYLNEFIIKYGKVKKSKNINCVKDYIDNSSEAIEMHWSSKNYLILACDYSQIKSLKKVSSSFINDQLIIYFIKKQSKEEIEAVKNKIEKQKKAQRIEEDRIKNEKINLIKKNL